MISCNICPRGCKVDRQTAHGYCGASNKICVSKVMLHGGEEPYLTTKNKPFSGAIFFSGCNLKCVYCQNWQISSVANIGKQISAEKLAQVFKNLEVAGAANIDLVTPTHYAKQIISALKIYKPKVPVIYNTSGYETTDTIKAILPYVDVFLFDLKYFSDQLASELSNAPNYFKFASQAIKLASANKPNIYSNGQLLQGVVVRHMCLPNNTSDSNKILDWLAANLGTDANISLLSQYTPMHKAKEYPQINRPLTPLEYKAVISHANKLGLTNVMCQELASATCEMVPDWQYVGEQFFK